MKYLKLRIVPILPRGVVATAAEYEHGMNAALDSVAEEATRLLEKTTTTWTTNVRFYTKRTKYGRGIYSRSQVWDWVDQGTKPHVIRPKGPWPLRFRVGGRPKTRPRYLTSYSGSPGNEWRASQGVQHPGTEPRNFSQRVKEETDKLLPKAMREAIAAAHARRRRK